MKTKTWQLLVAGLVGLALPGVGLGQNLVVNGGFETTTVTTGPGAPPLPSGPGYWYGDYSAIVSAQGGITPLAGSQMLQFIYAGHAPSVLVSCEIYQLVDLSAYAPLIGTGSAVARFAARYDRVPGDSQTDTAMYIRLMGYAGDISTFRSQYLNSEIVDESDLVLTDAEAGTWELAYLEVPLPVNTSFVAVKLGASENIYNDVTDVEFDGHYADAVTLEVVPEPAALAMLALGGLAALRRRRR